MSKITRLPHLSHFNGILVCDSVCLRQFLGLWLVESRGSGMVYTKTQWRASYWSKNCWADGSWLDCTNGWWSCLSPKKGWFAFPTIRSRLCQTAAVVLTDWLNMVTTTTPCLHRCTANQTSLLAPKILFTDIFNTTVSYLNTYNFCCDIECDLFQNFK